MERNLNVDYVIRYGFGGIGPSEASEKLERLLRTLAEKGIQTQVRQGDATSLLIFARASSKSLGRATHRSRVRDWLYGVRNIEPESDGSIQPETEAERLRVVYNMITLSAEEGGAEITPNHGEWENVVSIFPIHDDHSNKQWMRDWSKKTFLSQEDLDQVRDRFGEGVAFYFAFLQSYFKFLIFPAVFGFSCWLLIGSCSILYSVVNCLWGVFFIEYWKRSQLDLSCRWQTKGITAVLTKRREFKPDKVVMDEYTGESRGVFPATKRIYRQLLQAPFALLSVVLLGVILATCFAIEIFISEVYNGPFKSYLVFIPTVLVSSLEPTMAALLISIARKLNDYENYETQDAYNVALTRKIFVVNFITSYLPVCLTAFVYLPFAGLLVPYLDVFRLTVRPFVTKEEADKRSQFRIDTSRLRKQIIYFAVTAQVINFAMETIVPYAKQCVFREYKAYTNKHSVKMESGEKSADDKTAATLAFEDPQAEVEFLSRVRNEADLPEYDVSNDYREMCIQFGYLALFSSVWPMVPVAFFSNNWVEARGDFFRICVEFRRPVPQRTDTIGPWLDSLGFLSWLGSISSAALVYLFSNGQSPDGAPYDIRGWALLLAIFFSEHLYLMVHYAVGTAMAKFEPPNVRKERAERYLIRKRYLAATTTVEGDEGLGKMHGQDPGRIAVGEDSLSDITRASLEDDARAATLQETDATERFWMHQKSWKESAKVGVSMIQAQKAASVDSKKKQ